MRKLYLLFVLAALGLYASAQTTSVHRDWRLNQALQDPLPMVSHQNGMHGNMHHSTQHNNQLKSMRSVLHSQQIGSAGNILTVLQAECNVLDASDTLNAVTFIHRVDNTLPQLLNSNIGQYCYDESQDGGNTWNVNIGPITNNDSINPNYNINGRYPQAVIYNKPGNRTLDSALLIYSGTWHNEPPNTTTGSWVGQLVGRGSLSEDTSTYNVHIETTNGVPAVSIATGMCRGVPGTFWNLNENFTGTFSSGSSQIDQGLIFEKGVWNNATRDVNWTNQLVNQIFDSTIYAAASPSYNYSIATAFNMAFDPSGKYGWAVCLGNITPNISSDSVYVPIFWMSTDSGANWVGPMMVNLDSIPGVDQYLGSQIIAGQGPTSLQASTSFDDALTVDVYGNPHLLTTIGPGTEFAIQDASTGYDVWDITYDASAHSNSCTWQGIHLGKVFTFEGNQATSTISGDYIGNNRPLVSRTADGKKIFFFWEDSDTTFVSNFENVSPNLFGLGIDVVANKMTPVHNFTAGDSLWGGGTSALQAGVYGGAFFPEIGQTCLVQGNNYNIPLILTEIDYESGGYPAGNINGDNPAAFWYINNLDILASDFTLPWGTAPLITLNGPDTVTLHQDSSYVDQGATAYSCRYGNVPVTTINSLDTAQTGTYYEWYVATDSSGNSDTVVRVIIVGAPPVANFTYIGNIVAYQIEFIDESTNSPTGWIWNFGNGQGSVQQNPVENYTSTASYNVCLTASNSFGSSSQYCQRIQVTGIDNIDLSGSVLLFPNPSNGKVSVTVPNTLPDFTVSTFDVLGQPVSSPAEYKSGTTNVQLDLSAVSNGVYYIKIQSSAGSVVKNVVITHGSK